MKIAAYILELIKIRKPLIKLRTYPIEKRLESSKIYLRILFLHRKEKYKLSLKIYKKTIKDIKQINVKPFVKKSSLSHNKIFAKE